MITIFKYLSCLFFAILFCSISVEAKNVQVNVTGHGISHKMAVVEGLKEAIAQVSGVTVSSNEVLSLSSLVEENTSNSDILSHQQFTKETQSDVLTRINGFVSSYQVISSNRNDDGTYQVEMTVEIERYDVPGSKNNRRGIAVIGFKANKATCFGKTLDAQAQTDEITRALVNSLTATRKFSVLDRDNEDVYQLEKSLIKSGDAKSSEIAKLSQVKGTDYILTGLVKNLSITANKQKIELSGDTFTTYHADIEIDFKLLAFATRQVKFASSVKVSLNHSEISDKNCPNILSLLAEKISTKITDKCIENIYPPIIASVNGDKIYLNMGGDSVKKDSLYNIYDLGQKIIDPYTNESLGYEENQIATLRIIEIKPKYSIAVLEKGDITKIKQGQICRPLVQSPQKKPIVKKSKKQISENEW